MSDYKGRNENEIFTKVLKAGRRTYFFDVRNKKQETIILPLQKVKKNFGENGEANFREA